MNIVTEMSETPDREAAEAALATLRAWADTATPAEIAALDPAMSQMLSSAEYPALSRAYPEDFTAGDNYRASLPDLQNGPSSLIRGAQQLIQHVGISNFRLPIRYRSREGGDMRLETSVTGSVSLDAEKKGINMSRIMRSFYRHAEATFSFEVIEAALDDYKTDLESLDARIQMRFSFPMKIASLRSGLTGYQYYDIALELVEQDGERKKIVHLDYVYSSTCPCSLELSEHARQTQVMVKREDEQAFAELNAANPIFVEDAARLFCEQLLADGRVGDFRIVASHQESLHSHDAISVLTQGGTFAAQSIDPKLFNTLFHVG